MALTPEQVEFRKTGIGASESAAIFGVHPYLSAIELYARKIGVAKDVVESERLWWGSKLESSIIDRYTLESNASVTTDPEICHFRRLSYGSPIICNLDAWNSSEGIPVEAKTVGEDAWWQSWDRGKRVPLYIQCQAQHQMLVTGTQAAEIVALGPKFTMHTFRIERDQAFTKKLERRVALFWAENVQGRKVPGWDGSASCYEGLKAVHPAGELEGITELPELQSAVLEYRELDEVLKTANERRSALKNQIFAELGDHRTADLGDGFTVTRTKGNALKVKEAA